MEQTFVSVADLKNRSEISNVLVLGPSGSHDTESVCTDLLTSETDDQYAVLSITLEQPPESRIAVWDAHVDQDPAAAAVLAVGDRARATERGGITRAGHDWVDRDFRIETITDPTDLTELGVRCTTHLERWETKGLQVVACFHSVTALLKAVARRLAYRFLSVLTVQMRTQARVAHYHMDPGAHDEQTIETFTTLFDAVVSTSDSELSINTG